MIDPAHGRWIPEGRDLAAVIQQMFARFGQEARRDAQRGEVWDPSRIDLNEYANAVTPIMLRYYQMGGYMTYEGLYRSRRQSQDFLQLDTVSQSGKVAGLIEKRLPTVQIGQESLRLSFNVFNPEVLDAVRTMAMHFVESTLATVVEQVANAYDAVRQQLGAALSQGEALRDISARVLAIFDEPDRAFTIASTESSRAMHSGSLYVARANGVEEKTWMASSDACPRCLELDGKTVPIDKPFYVSPKGGRYAVVKTAPLHPRCQCTVVFE
jgi:hypothetical protein